MSNEIPSVPDRRFSFMAQNNRGRTTVSPSDISHNSQGVINFTLKNQHIDVQTRLICNIDIRFGSRHDLAMTRLFLQLRWAPA